MGCWYSTCMISRLPIMDKEKIKLVVLDNRFKCHEIGASSGYCSPDDIFTVVSYPISGKCNEYGMITDIEEDYAYRKLLNYMEDTLTPTIKIDRDKEVDNWSIYDVLSGIERRELSTIQIDRDGGDKILIPAPFSFVMIREDVWNNLIQMGLKINDLVERWQHIKTTQNFIDDSIKEYKETVLDIHSKVCESKDIVEKISSKFKLNNGILRFLRTEFNHMRTGYNVREDYYKVVVENDTLLSDEIEKHWSELTIIEELLNRLRLSWMVQAGLGSQYVDFDIHRDFNNMIANISSVQHDKRDDEWDDEWDDDDE